MPKKDVTITLTVDTDGLWGNESVDTYCSLSDDNNGSTPNGKPEKFESAVYPSRKVTWIVKKKFSNAEKDVELTEVDYERGEEIFGNNPLFADNNGKIKQDVLDDAATGDEDTYKIKFKLVDKSQNSHQDNEVDPKLRVHDR